MYTLHRLLNYKWLQKSVRHTLITQRQHLCASSILKFWPVFQQLQKYSIFCSFKLCKSVTISTPTIDFGWLFLLEEIDLSLLTWTLVFCTPNRLLLVNATNILLVNFNLSNYSAKPQIGNHEKKHKSPKMAPIQNSETVQLFCQASSQPLTCSHSSMWNKLHCPQLEYQM